VEPAGVGLISIPALSSPVSGGADTVRQILQQFKNDYGETEIGLCVVTIVELTHGIQRAGTEGRRQRRQAFVEELIRDVPVHPVTIETARLAGRIEGGQAAQGVSIAFEDLLIAATALQLAFGVVTGNVRHFEIAPGLKVVKSTKALARKQNASPESSKTFSKLFDQTHNLA